MENTPLYTTALVQAPSVGCGKVSSWGSVQIWWANSPQKTLEPGKGRHGSCLHNKEWPHTNQNRRHKDHQTVSKGESGHHITFFPLSSCALNAGYFHLVSGPSALTGVIKSSVKTLSFVHSGMAACLPESLAHYLPSAVLFSQFNEI